MRKINRKQWLHLEALCAQLSEAFSDPARQSHDIWRGDVRAIQWAAMWIRKQLDLEVIHCDCGAPYKESDAYDTAGELLKAVKSVLAPPPSPEPWMESGVTAERYLEAEALLSLIEGFPPDDEVHRFLVDWRAAREIGPSPEPVTVDLTFDEAMQALDVIAPEPVTPPSSEGKEADLAAPPAIAASLLRGIVDGTSSIPAWREVCARLLWAEQRLTQLTLRVGALLAACEQKQEQIDANQSIVAAYQDSLTQLTQHVETEAAYRRVAWDSQQLLTDRASVAERMRVELEAKVTALYGDLDHEKTESDEAVAALRAKVTDLEAQLATLDEQRQWSTANVIVLTKHRLCTCGCPRDRHLQTICRDCASIGALCSQFQPIHLCIDAEGRRIVLVEEGDDRG